MQLRSRVAATVAAVALGAPGCAQIIGADFDEKVLCLTTEDCAAAGKHFICDKAAAACVSLTSDLCPSVYGDDTRDGAFIIGSIFPTTGPDQTVGKPLEEALALAVREFGTSGDLPPRPGETAVRPLVVVGCTDESNGDVAARAARHLIDDVHVPAIIGPAFSGITIQLATQVTIPAGVMLFSPASTSVSITNLDDHGLVWRTAPSDTLQAAALSLYVPTVEQEVRASLGLATTDKVRLVMLNKGDAYGRDLASALEKSLTLNDAPATSPGNAQSYKRIDYGNLGDPSSPPDYAQAVAKVLAFQPHIVAIAGTNEGVTEVFAPIEQGWPKAAGFAPAYVFSDGGAVPELWDFVAENDPMGTLRPRIHGTEPGTAGPRFDLFRSNFLAHFADESSPDVFGAGAYDIVYLLAYSAASLGEQPVSGASLAAGMGALVPPAPPLDVGKDNITTAFTALSTGKIDFGGASGPLDFDLSRGEAPSAIQIWCLPADAGGKAASAVYSGLFFDPATMLLTGTETACP
jgi:branched-chain amino acid transport system substrate-binding protein